MRQIPSNQVNPADRCAPADFSVRAACGGANGCEMLYRWLRRKRLEPSIEPRRFAAPPPLSRELQ